VNSEVIQTWTNLVRNRSIDNSEAFRLLFEAKNRSAAFGILRQELDSLIRAIFLSQHTILERTHLASLTLDGQKWRRMNSKEVITDRKMVDFAQELEGWAKYVYKFGCSFIHLSDLHLATDIRLADKLDPEERLAIRSYVKRYHSVDLSEQINLSELFAVSDRIFQKIHDNLECYLEQLEQGIGTDSFL